MRLAVTGTDTGVGKTIVAAALLAMLRRDGLRVAGMKPLETGLVHSDVMGDAELLRMAAGDDGFEDVCPLAVPDSVYQPAATGRATGADDIRLLDSAFARISTGRDAVLVEDPGGLLAPVAPSFSFDRLARRWKLDLLIIAANRPGVIHHVQLLTRAARDADLRIRGLVLNDAYADHNGLEESVVNDALAGTIPGVPVYRFPFVARPLDHAVLAAAASNAGLDALRTPVITLPAQPLLADVDGEGARA